MTAAVIASCADHYGLLVDQVLGPYRGKRCVRARQAAMYVLRYRDQMSTTAVGRIMGRDHSTVLHACSEVEELRNTDADLGPLITMLMDLPRYHREVERVAVPEEVQLEFPAPPSLKVPIRLSRRRNPHPAICTVQRKAKNDLSPDDSDAIRRMRGTDKLLSALARAGYA